MTETFNPDRDKAPLDPTAGEHDLHAEIARLSARIATLETELAAARATHPPAGRRWCRARAAPTTAATRSQAGVDWRWDALAIVLLVALTVTLRLVHLGTAPRGIHGDEAATGLEARRIIESGWIGVYSPIAAGNPTGVYYLATIPVRLFDDPVIAVRSLQVLMGTVAVAAVYLLVRRRAGVPEAALAAGLLAVSGWHLGFSRTAFVTGTWPAVALLAAIALMEAIRTRDWAWWAAAGALVASGVYVYNAHLGLMTVFVAFALWTWFGWRALAIGGALAITVLAPNLLSLAILAASLASVGHPRFRDRRRLAEAGSFLLAGSIVLLPMISYARAHRDIYFGRGSEVSLFNTEQWTAAGRGEQVRLLVERYWRFWDRLSFEPVYSAVDLSGITPLVPPLTLGLVLMGAAVALARRRSPLALLSAAIVAIAPLTPILTDFAMRRALAIIPFMAVLAGIGLVELVRIAARWDRRMGFVAGGLLVVLLAQSGWENGTDFFRRTTTAEAVNRTFALELRDSAAYLAALPDDAYIYLYSRDWVLDYDTIRYLAPGLHGENRHPKWGGSGTFDTSPHGPNVVMFFAPSAFDMVDAAKRAHPDGVVVTGPVEGPPLNGPAFIAIELPAGS